LIIFFSVKVKNTFYLVVFPKAEVTRLKQFKKRIKMRLEWLDARQGRISTAAHEHFQGGRAHALAAQELFVEPFVFMGHSHAVI
jgi:hypothetical protein